MATISYTTDFASKLERVSKVIHAVADRDTKFLSMFLKMSEPIDALKYEWVDKTLVGLKDALKSALTSTTTTTITVYSSTASPKRYVDGYSLMRVDDEVMLISSTITVSTNYSSYNVTRAQLGTTGATHAVGAKVLIYAKPRAEGFAAGRDDSQKGVRYFNYTQIFERELKLTGSSQSIASVEQETLLNKQAADLLPELVKELQTTFIHGLRYANDSTNYTDRKMGGFYYWATQVASSNNTDAGTAPISFTMFDDVIEAYLNKGGDGTKLCALTSIRQQRKINDLKEARVVSGGMSQNETKITNYVTTYDFGSRAQVEVISIPDLDDDEIYFFQKDKVGVHPLQDRGFKKKPLPEDGDFVRQLILGEYTSVFRNVNETLYRYHNLAV
jgi:hypothetical protein